MVYVVSIANRPPKGHDICYNKNNNQGLGRIINNRASTFIQSKRGISLRSELEKMETSKLYNTKSMYSTIDANGVSFVDKHMRYMSQYPLLNCEQYVSNLKLKTKIK